MPCLIENLNLLKTKSEESQNKKFLLISEIIHLLQTKELEEQDKLIQLLNLFCELCEYKDWDIMLEMFIYLLSELKEIKPLFEMCKEREVKDSGLYLYLHLVKHLSKIERYDSALELLKWVLDTVVSRKDKFHFSEHIWDFMFVTGNVHMYTLINTVSDEHLKKIKINRSEIISNLLEKNEWITDPLFLVDILNEKITELLDQSDFAQAEKFYHWVEQLMFYFWDIFTHEDSKDLLNDVNEIKKRIESQHFI